MATDQGTRDFLAAVSKLVRAPYLSWYDVGREQITHGELAELPSPIRRIYAHVYGDPEAVQGVVYREDPDWLAVVFAWGGESDFFDIETNSDAEIEAALVRFVEGVIG